MDPHLTRSVTAHCSQTQARSRLTFPIHTDTATVQDKLALSLSQGEFDHNSGGKACTMLEEVVCLNTKCLTRGREGYCQNAVA